jgi:NADH-quinone oxidoreductase subunit J
MMSEIFFIGLGLVVLFLALLTIFSRSPVSGAMLLIVLMFLLAGMYGLLEAHFSAVAQVIVYAGAIMVVFVFVIMLLNIPEKQIPFDKPKVSECLLGGLVFLMAMVPLFLLLKHEIVFEPVVPRLNAPYYPPETGENVKNVAALMFTEYLWSFEIISLAILISIVGAIVLAKKEGAKK